ncbi:TetR/AcrR family transcriptional regulator [Listeria sp. FSL L7-1582]|uniref:TetR/AcrR family transcriptional regulator n=1 Tax=Listeria portnoyi TaxID=2713504 RepID=UPI00164D4E85|nr:TetR/AcrR family transcriptional regulator [Listeria portnoyi]MBC6310078.1 TetR/AcrR family transcriptional regulator [Listeria portnoyi]
MKRRGLTREIVLEKALEITYQKGFRDLTYNGLARELSVQPQSLYRWVSNIADVKSSVLATYLGSLVDALQAELENYSGKEVLEIFAKRFSEFVEADSIDRFNVLDILSGLTEYGHIETVNEVLLNLRELALKPVRELTKDPASAHLNELLFLNVVIGYITLASTGLQPADSKQAFQENIQRIITLF